MPIDQKSQYLCVRIKGRWLGLEIDKVLEIVNPVEKDNVFFKNDDERQTINYQETVIPVVHIADILTGEQVKYDQSYRIVVCELDGDRMGLVVDSADEIVRLNNSDMKKPSGQDSNFSNDILKGSYSLEDRLIHILEMEQITKLVKTI